MLNYGSSITSAFPNTFCSSPDSLICQLCNSSLNEKYNGSNYIHNLIKTHYASGSKLEKCTHCGINICENCFNENQEANFDNHTPLNGPNKFYQKNRSIDNNQSNAHYNVVKKEFKQMYNYSKEIVEKLHLLNNAIKVEESAVTELNLIKHQVSTKAIDLIKQINQEKNNLIEQIENVKKRYESTLNDRKEYYALSMQYKDELRKVIKKYKDFKSDEHCTLSDLLKMYFSVKNISKSLDDYDHIQLITEQDPLQVKFEEKAVFRNLIGKLLLNGSEIIDENLILKENLQNKNDVNVLNLMEASKKHEKLTLFDKNLSRSQLLDTTKNKDNSSSSKLSDRARETVQDPTFGSLSDKTNKNVKQEFSRSFSLNDLISAANELINQQAENDLVKKKNYVPKSQQNLNKLKEYTENNTEDNIFFQKNNIKGETNNSKEYLFNNNNYNNKRDKRYHNQNNQFNYHHKESGINDLIKNRFLSNSNKQIQQTSTPSYYSSPMVKKNFILPNKISPQQQHQHPKLNFQSILKNSSNQQSPLPSKNSNGSGTSLVIEKDKFENLGKSIIPNEELNNIIEQYRLKQSPKQRLEIDILPSHLSCCKNKLLIASSFGKIRVIDLFSYKIQKDELKNLLINGICLNKKISEITSESDTEILYAITNGQMNPEEDILNVNNSCIVVTNKELKILKKENTKDNDDFVFMNPSGICYDDNGNLYICDSGNNRVKAFDSNLILMSTITTASNSQDYLSQPKSVSTFENLLFVCDSANHRIVAYYISKNGPEFKYKCSYGLGYGDEPGMLRYPLECCVDNQGILFVRDHHNNRVQLFDADGVHFHHIEVNSQKETIYSMTVAENGDIYVAKMVHIHEHDQNGQLNTINKYYIDIY